MTVTDVNNLLAEPAAKRLTTTFRIPMAIAGASIHVDLGVSSTLTTYGAWGGASLSDTSDFNAAANSTTDFVATRRGLVSLSAILEWVEVKQTQQRMIATPFRVATISHTNSVTLPIFRTRERPWWLRWLEEHRAMLQASEMDWQGAIPEPDELWISRISNEHVLTRNESTCY